MAIEVNKHPLQHLLGKPVVVSIGSALKITGKLVRLRKAYGNFIGDVQLPAPNQITGFRASKISKA